jgi:chitinase
VATKLSSSAYVFTGLSPNSVYFFAVRAQDEAGSSAETVPMYALTAPLQETIWAKQIMAPYADWGNPSTPYLPDVLRETGVKYFSPGFIVSDGSCRAVWAGTDSQILTNTARLYEVQTLRSKGGDIIPSFGGAGSDELALHCGTVTDLAAAYQAVIDTLDVNRIDFDIEGSSLSPANAATIDLRNKAVALVQRNAKAQGRTLMVQYTIPVGLTGLPQNVVGVLQNALDNGVQIATINIMAMAYDTPAVNHQMGAAAVGALDGTVQQLAKLYPEKSTAQLRAMTGVTVRIGVATGGEVFTFTGDAPLLRTTAENDHIGELSFWSIGRDRICTGSNQPPSEVCSGVGEPHPFSFASYFDAFETE